MGKKILVADSDSVVQQVVSYFLKLEGFDVEVVGDGVSAMEAIEKISPNAIIMTPVLPGLNGVEVSHFIRENPQYKAIPIIFLSESEEPLLNNIPDLSQKFGIVNKPIDPTKLVNTVKEYLEKGSAPAEEIVESLKSIEELLGWDISDKKLVHRTEEVVQKKPMEGSFDVSEMLAGIIRVPEKETEVIPATQLMDETPECHPELVSGSQTMPGQEIPKQVRDDRYGGDDSELTKEDEKIPLNPPFSKGEISAPQSVREEISAPSSVIGEISFPTLVKGGEGGFDTVEHVEAELKSRITDEMIDNMLKKIAVDIVERVTREVVPDIAEREITKEIERLKGIE